MPNLSQAGALSRHLTMRQMRMVLAIEEHKSVLIASRELYVAASNMSSMRPRFRSSVSASDQPLYRM